MMIDVPRRPVMEKVVLAGMLTPKADTALFEEDMHEMGLLCATAGATVAATVVQRRNAPQASTYIGGGKLEEIRALMEEHGCTALVLDADLSPGQVRNIEEIIKAKVIDRSQLILDIFAQHATTNEARIQVELAQMRTLYPRLTHAWTHFSQQVGGIGTRGPGEKQLEVDRRLVQKKITDLQRRLKDVDRSYSVQRKSRETMFNIVLVGYTNVGKSSLLNALSAARANVENKLFATLDTNTRRFYIPGYGIATLTDTVGFIRKLPHHLVASFRSTLDVACEADLLLVVMDASSAWTQSQMDTVNQALDELGAAGQSRLVVFNKSDLLADPFQRKTLELAYPEAVFVSALKREGTDQLKECIGRVIKGREKERQLKAAMKAKAKKLKGVSEPVAP